MHMHLRYKPVDFYRLLKLRTWSIRYYTTPLEILELTVPVLRTQMARQKRTYGLGVNIATLTGRSAERILCEELAKKYPSGENR